MKSRIKQRRLDLGISSQAALGRAAGVTRAAVSSWENGTNKPKGDTLIALAKALQCSPEWLNSGKNSNRIETIQSGGDSEQQPDTSNQIKLIKKADIGAYLNGEHVRSEPLPSELSKIKEYFHGSDRTFAYIEDVASIQSLIIPGETIIMVDPGAGISATGRGRHYLANVNDRYLIGYIEETASGMMLNFDNRSPGWDAIAITPGDCVGRVLSAFERNWK